MYKTTFVIIVETSIKTILANTDTCYRMLLTFIGMKIPWWVITYQVTMPEYEITINIIQNIISYYI